MICKKIAFAGGPCSGKSSVHAAIKKYAVNPNYNVIFLDEVATAFLNEVPPFVSNIKDKAVLQYYIFRTQLLLEETAINEAEKCEKKTLIIIDRCVFDLYVYLDKHQIMKIISPEQEQELNTRYDCVLFFEPFFDAEAHLNSNPARIEESVQQLLLVADKTKQAYANHCTSKMFSIFPTEKIEEKARQSATIINSFVNDEVFIIPDTVIE